MTDLRADCSRCSGLCCVAPAFAASADFAFDKPAGQPCRNLRADFRCSVHDRLRPLGFRGCASFDCLGAGQKVTQSTFGGRTWREDPKLAPAMFAAFAVMRQLHELLWYLDAARRLDPPEPLRSEVDALVVLTQQRTDCPPAEMTGLDVGQLRDLVNSVLLRVSAQVRSRGGPPGSDVRGSDLRGADLAGHDLRGADLRRASLRGALLIGARLSGCDLSLADVTGADLRDADLAGARMADTIFLSQAQVDAAAGDAATTLPSSLSRPPHWPAGT